MHHRRGRGSGSGSETLQTPDNHLLLVKVGGVWELYPLVIWNPELEQRLEEIPVEGAGEGERHKCPGELHRVGIFVSQGNEVGSFLHCCGSCLLSRLADPNRQEDEGFRKNRYFNNINEITGTEHSINQNYVKTWWRLEQNWRLIKEQEQRSKRDD